MSGSTHLFKLFHGEHLLGELQYQVLPHWTRKHLVKNGESERNKVQHKEITLKLCSFISPLSVQMQHLLDRLLNECFGQGDVFTEEQRRDDLQDKSETRNRQSWALNQLQYRLQTQKSNTITLYNYNKQIL